MNSDLEARTPRQPERCPQLPRVLGKGGGGRRFRTFGLCAFVYEMREVDQPLYKCPLYKYSVTLLLQIF